MSQRWSIAAATDPTAREILALPPNRELRTYYDILGVTPDSSPSFLDLVIIERIERVRRYQIGSSQAKALELLELLSRIYVLLTDPEERRQYDASLVAEVTETHQPSEAHRAGAQFPNAPFPNAPLPDAPLPDAPLPDTPIAGAPPGVCPKCGKPSSEHAARCYHCGFQKSAPRARPKARVETPLPLPEAAGFWSVDVRSWKDLTPEQIQSRLRLQRGLFRAQKLGQSHWKPPGESGFRPGKSTPIPRSVCYRCGKPLLSPENVCGISQVDLTRNREFLTMYARRFESLGRNQFQWPLDSHGFLQVREMLPHLESQRVILVCHPCAERFLLAGDVELPGDSGETVVDTRP